VVREWKLGMIEQTVTDLEGNTIGWVREHQEAWAYWYGVDHNGNFTKPTQQDIDAMHWVTRHEAWWSQNAAAESVYRKWKEDHA